MKATEPVTYRRGDILWVRCEPSIGVEPRKLRTCVVVSNDIANQFGQAVTIIPTQVYTTERAGRSYMVDLRRPRSNLDKPRIANASMIMTYDRRRVVKRAGKVTAETLQRIEDAVRLHLGMDARS
jgi:mRNA interferase MazF